MSEADQAVGAPERLHPLYLVTGLGRGLRQMVGGYAAVGYLALDPQGRVLGHETKPTRTPTFVPGTKRPRRVDEVELWIERANGLRRWFAAPAGSRPCRPGRGGSTTVRAEPSHGARLR